MCNVDFVFKPICRYVSECILFNIGLGGRGGSACDCRLRNSILCLMRILDGSENNISACAATFACEVCALGVRRLFIQMESHLEDEVTSYERQACMNDGSNLVLACNIRRLSVLWEAPFRAWQIGVKDAS